MTVVARIVALIVAAVVAALVLVLVSARPVAGPGPTPLPAVSAPMTPSGAAGAATPAVQATPVATPEVATPRVGATTVSATPATGTPAAGDTATPSTATPSTGTGPSPSAATGILIDQSLLDILPKTVAGSTVVADANRETETASDTALATYARALAAATVGDNGENIATIILVERRPEVAMADWFPRYRADFDSAACDPIGGPGSTSTRTLAGREVQVTSCKDGGIVYHVIVDGGTTIMSVFELGPKEFGRVLLENLAPGA